MKDGVSQRKENGVRRERQRESEKKTQMEAEKWKKDIYVGNASAVRGCTSHHTAGTTSGFAHS